MEARATLLRPPPDDPEKAPIENVLEITELGVLGPDIFTNTRPPWHPPGARGIFGGAVIAQSLAAGQRTVPPDFTIHSCHCYFLLAGSSSVPLLFHVERVRDGRSFATRTVQARQRGRCIFTVTMSFAKEGSGGVRQVRHAVGMPEGRRVLEPPEEGGELRVREEVEEGGKGKGKGKEEGKEDEEMIARDPKSPWLTTPIEITTSPSIPARKCRQWIKARGKISPQGGYAAHANALAYISDSYFIGTVTRIHNLWRFPFRPHEVASLPPHLHRRLQQILRHEGVEDVDWRGRPELGMIVSLDHSIYFHEPRAIRADEWMFSEMESPWAGEGRGVVTQRIFGRDGTLLATCVQEGVVRLRQDGEEEGDGEERSGEEPEELEKGGQDKGEVKAKL